MLMFRSWRKEVAVVRDDEPLPWECPNGEPHGSGICLSGGGLRAASFAMGAVQALQAERGLLYGPRAADHLAVVSGGSYIGAAAMLSASRAGETTPPLAPGAPESSHIVGHSRYLVEDGVMRSAGRFAWRLVVGWIAAALLLTWTGFMLADVAVLVDHYWPGLQSDGWLAWPLLVVAFAAAAALGVSAQTDRVHRQWLFALAGIAGVGVAGPTMLAQVERTEWLRRPLWWMDPWQLTLLVGVLYLVLSVVPFAVPQLAGLANGLTQNAL